MDYSFPNPELDTLFLQGDIQKCGWYYSLMRGFCAAIIPLFCRPRVFNRHFEPASGGVLYISNHQSFLDPMLIGMSMRRPLNFMARSSLFKAPGFAQLISSVNAFPVNRGTADMSAIKEAMKRLKNNRQLVIFAEGTRTTDGRVQEFLPGVALLARKSADWVVPTVVDGSYEAWPRNQKLPSFGNTVVKFGEPIPREKLRKYDSKQLLTDVRQTIITMQAEVRQKLGRPEIKY